MTSSRLVGTIIENKYSLDEQIGHGGMGAVYRGTQLMVDRTVAIKLLQAEFASHDNFKARFEVEAKAIGRMNHPNCITLFDFGYSQNIEAFYTVVEFINGRSLGTLLSEDISLSAIISVIRQIASGLDHAHHHGILHRDLKPENIMLARMTDGTEMVKVLDFGIAQIVKGTGGTPPTQANGLNAPMDDDFESDRITRVGEVFGTPPYMSPEQARSTRNLTPACDIYSLGVIFYELVAGHLPFFSDSPLDILLMHINEPPPPIMRLDFLPELHAIIMGMLEKDPARRIQSGQELISMLDAINPEYLEKESSQNAQNEAHNINSLQSFDTSPRSWVETVDTGETAALIPDFAPPPQAQLHSRTESVQLHTPNTALASPSQKSEPADRSKGFKTIITFDEIEAKAATQRTTRWSLLVFITALGALLIFLLFNYEDEIGTLLLSPTDTNQTAFQNPSAPSQPDPEREVVADPHFPIDTEAATASEDTFEPPAASPIIIAPAPEKPTFPEATRPATQKKQAKSATKQQKKTPATTPRKSDKIKYDDSSNPPSKGPRILEF